MRERVGTPGNDPGMTALTYASSRFSGSRPIVLGGRVIPDSAATDFILDTPGPDFRIIDGPRRRRAPAPPVQRRWIEGPGGRRIRVERQAWAGRVAAIPR